MSATDALDAARTAGIDVVLKGGKLVLEATGGQPPADVVAGLKRHKACVRGLGLRRMHQIVEVEDTPCTRGMINKISYMLEVEET